MPRLMKVPPEIRKVVFDERRILARLGRRNRAREINAELMEILREETGRAERLARPQVLAALIHGSDLPDHPVFAGAVSAAVCLCTIGSALEETAARLTADGDLARGFILDVLGSEAVDGVSKRADEWLAGHGVALGLWPSKRFAPGCKGWGLSGQEIIFGFLPAEEIGVRLTEALMMVPRKSYSFRINYLIDRTKTTRSFAEKPSALHSRSNSSR
jgi:hypothetical protein